MQQFNLTRATCLDVKEEHFCLPAGKRIYYRWVSDKDQAIIDFIHPNGTYWVQTIIAGSLFRAMHAMEDAAQEEQRRYANMLKYQYYETPAEKIPVISPGKYVILQRISSLGSVKSGYVTFSVGYKVDVVDILRNNYTSPQGWVLLASYMNRQYQFDYLTFIRSAQAEWQSDLLQTVDNFTKRQREVEIKQKEAEVKEKMAIVDRLTAARAKLAAAVMADYDIPKHYEGRNGTIAHSSMKNPQMGPGYKQLEVGYDDPTGDDFLVGVNEW